MIARKIKRKGGRQRTHASELAYIATLSRYVVRAGIADLEKIAQETDDPYVRDLTAYIVASGRTESVLASGTINLLATTLEGQQAELMAIMHMSRNCSDVTDHWVLSWPANEDPTKHEVEETIAIFLRCQGLEKCPVVWGYHRDTDNPHVHLAILRVDPVTGRRVTAGQGWDIDTAHRAKAVIEDRFPHWHREEGSLYCVENGMLVDLRTNDTVGRADNPKTWSSSKSKKGKKTREHTARPIKLDEQSRAYEQRTGLKSRKRIALEIAAPIALSSTSWDECHRKLAAEGIELRKTQVRGAEFIIDGKPVKASINRETSFSKLKDRYDSDFVASVHKVQPSPLREIWPSDEKRQDYYRQKRAHDHLRDRLVSAVRRARGRRSSKDSESLALDAAVDEVAFPSFEDWCRGARAKDPGDVIDDVLGAGLFSPDIAANATPNAAPSVTLIPGFKATKLSDRVLYHRQGDPPGKPSFIDLGDRVLVRSSTDREAAKAALLLFVKNDPGCAVAVTGSHAFKRLTLEIAMEEGVTLSGMLGVEQRARQTVSSASAQAMQAVKQAISPSPRTPRPSPPGPRPAASQSAHKAPRYKTQSPTPQPTRQFDRTAVLAMVARIFHSSDWDTADFWGSRAPESRDVASEPPIEPRVMTDIEPRSGDEAPYRAKPQPSRVFPPFDPSGGWGL